MKHTLAELKRLAKMGTEKVSKKNPYWYNEQQVNSITNAVAYIVNTYDVTPKQEVKLNDWVSDLKTKLMDT